MEKEQIINLVAAAVISSTVLNGIITHLLYTRKLKKEQRVRAEGVTGDKILEALFRIRDIELKCCEMELLEKEDWLLDGNRLNFFNYDLCYPAIMNDSKSLDLFFDMINSARREEERYLDYKTASYLAYMESYILSLIEYLYNNKLEDVYPLVGYVFQRDFMKWQTSIEKNVVKVINSSKYKLNTKIGRKWISNQKRIRKKMWNKSLLRGVLNNSNDIQVRMAKALLSEDTEQIKFICEKYKGTKM